MTASEARAILQAHIERCREILEKATPGSLSYELVPYRWSTEGYSIKSTLGTAGPRNFPKFIASVPGGTTATQSAMLQFSNDAALICACWNALPAHILAVEALKNRGCRNACDQLPIVPEVPLCQACAAIIAVAEALAEALAEGGKR